MLRIIVAALGIVLFSASPASAALETTTKLTFNSKGTLVDSFATGFGNVTGEPSRPAFNIYGGPDIAPGTTVFGAVSTPDYYLDRYFYFGVTTALPGPGPGAAATRHLVMGINQSLAGQSFADLFPDHSEAALVDAIVRLNAGTAPYFGDEYNLLTGFQYRYAPQYAFDLTGTGYLTAFSTGADFGTIVTSQSSVYVPDAVPEPATWAMMIVGLGTIGLLCRRRVDATDAARNSPRMRRRSPQPT